jgi:hypothetical protein
MTDTAKVEVVRGWRSDEPYDKNSWGTPDYILDAVREAFGGQIDCDPASNAKAQERVRADFWMGPGSPYGLPDFSEDGLDYCWTGNVWLNPPYGKGLVQPFADRLYYEYSPRAAEIKTWDELVTSHAVLVNLDPSTEWFRSFESCSTHLVNLGRVAFLHPDTGLPVKGNSRSQCLLVRNVNLEPLRKLGSVYAKA